MKTKQLSRWLGLSVISLISITLIGAVIVMMAWGKPTPSSPSTKPTQTPNPLSSTQSPTLVVPPETFHAPDNKPSANPQLHSHRANIPISPTQQTLAPLSPDELQQIEHLQAERLQPQDTQNNHQARATQIGLGRDLSSHQTITLTNDSLTWADVPDGKVAHWLIESPNAQALRLLIQAKTFPKNAELRFFSPHYPEQLYGIYKADDLLANNHPFWSPTVQGQALGLEIFLPHHAPIELSLPKISHVYADIFSATTLDKPSKTVKGTTRGTADGCHVDLACADTTWQAVGQAVAKYIYVKANGSAYYCTGTLLADHESNTQIPYFATANHCISDSNTAATMDFYWLYQHNSCANSLTKSTALRTHQGGTLLANLPETDMTLVLLTQSPPNGTTLAGWRLNAPQPNSSVVGIHHPNGDVKKYSAGIFEQFETITISNGWYMIEQNPDGNFMQVRWSTGITAGGSSGSGLWEMDNNTPYFIGVLSGGSSYCNAPNAPDDYGRFDRSYSAFSQWLNPTTPTVNLNVTASGTRTSALKDGILLARYLQGLRGDALLQGIAEDENSQMVGEKLAQSISLLDVDQDGQVNAEYDALLVVRYLLGLRGEPLIREALSPQAQRQTSREIEDFLQNTLTQ